LKLKAGKPEKKDKLSLLKAVASQWNVLMPILRKTGVKAGLTTAKPIEIAEDKEALRTAVSDQLSILVSLKLEKYKGLLKAETAATSSLNSLLKKLRTYVKLDKELTITAAKVSSAVTYLALGGSQDVGDLALKLKAFGEAVKASSLSELNKLVKVSALIKLSKTSTKEEVEAQMQALSVLTQPALKGTLEVATDEKTKKVLSTPLPFFSNKSFLSSLELIRVSIILFR